MLMICSDSDSQKKANAINRFPDSLPLILPVMHARIIAIAAFTRRCDSCQIVRMISD